jgi:hypothetical protein
MNVQKKSLWNAIHLPELAARFVTKFSPGLFTYTHKPCQSDFWYVELLLENISLLYQAA